MIYLSHFLILFIENLMLYICFLNLYFEIMVQFHKFHVITYLKSMLLCLNIDYIIDIHAFICIYDIHLTSSALKNIFAYFVAYLPLTKSISLCVIVILGKRKGLKKIDILLFCFIFLPILMLHLNALYGK